MLRKWIVPCIVTACILFAGFQIFNLVQFFLGEAERDAADGDYVETTALPGEEDVVIRNGSKESDYLTFTCNVDWGEEILPDMLKTFEEKGVKVTFFVSGKWAEKNPKLLREMFVRGHEIQTHGYSHKLCSKISLEELREEITKSETAIRELIGQPPTVFAPPSGDYDEKTLDLCREMGYKLSLWSSDTIDWREGSTAQVITSRILKKPLAGAIVLMHPKEETAKALPGLIDEIREQGIEIVPLSQLGVL